MESIYLLIVIVLIVLAISDLVVGVSNDAVNFLNSAIGAKAAPVLAIMIIASLGILFGTTFSSGLMEVARKGIFHPDQFYFSEIMIIFLAVMLTDIILLDFFNTLGLPTSTTVSIVFELLGAAVAVSLIKIGGNEDTLADLGKYINSEKALLIISGILLSVFIAFLVGAIVQFITRIVFSFQYEKNLRFFGSIWGGMSITAITYFILIKGAKGSSFITPEMLEWINSNTILIIVYCFVGWTLILQVLNWAFKLSIPKFIILVGTFALAMAFAGNDLVNFIGVPLAGLEAYKEYISVGHAQFPMIALTEKIQTPTFLLLLAGAIMIITLWLSKKAMSVTRTEINLARQVEGEERFGSTLLSRSVVKVAVSVNNGITKTIPPKTLNALNKRFSTPNLDKRKTDIASFDLLRASSNLTIASILIAFATSLKLPLSTTYVTFMTAMGTSLADRAWGRESAVYRVTGVFTVVGGWFLTAISAFSVAALFAVIIHYTSYIGIIILVSLAIFLIARTYIFFRKKESEITKRNAEEIEDDVLNGDNVISKCSNTVSETIKTIPGLLKDSFDGLTLEDLKKLKKVAKKVKDLNKKAKYLKDNIHSTIDKLEEDSIETGHYYVEVLGYLREIAHCLNFIIQPVFEHVDNNHKSITEDQKSELSDLVEAISQFLFDILEIVNTGDFRKMDEILSNQQQLLDTIEKLKKKQIRRIKNNEVGTRNSILYLGILEEMKNLALYIVNLLKSHRDFIIYHKNSDNNQQSF
ncbi:MAG: inorganic phosphate transporter [Bacteroidota bacterium]|nr:inorganic phosphate transporter [Bacteroidota bacterium]